jgi:hypothetical protein
LVNLMQLPMSANRRGSSMSARSKPPGSRKAMFARIFKARHEDRTLAATALEKAAAATSAAPRPARAGRGAASGPSREARRRRGCRGRGIGGTNRRRRRRCYIRPVGEHERGDRRNRSEIAVGRAALERLQNRELAAQRNFGGAVHAVEVQPRRCSSTSVSRRPAVSSI